MAAGAGQRTKKSNSGASLPPSSLKILINHGTDKYELFVTEADQDESFTVGEFARRVESVTGVPTPNQRLIFKGRSLADMSAPFTSVGFTNNCKVMLLGKKHHPDEEGHMTAMLAVEKDIDSTEIKLSQLTKQLSDIQGGFLAADLQEEGLVKLGRQVASSIESFQLQLERLDALTLAQSSADVQNRRRALVRRIQALLDKADSLHAQSEETLAKLNC